MPVYGGWLRSMRLLHLTAAPVQVAVDLALQPMALLHRGFDLAVDDTCNLPDAPCGLSLATSARQGPMRGTQQAVTRSSEPI